MPALDIRAEFDPASANADRRTVRLTWTTGARVLRGGGLFSDPYYEELSLDPAHVRMGRLQSGKAPLLNSHSSGDIDDVIGVVETARLDSGGRSGSATVRFDTGPAGEEAFRKVRDGILGNVSVGYRVYRMSEIEDENSAIGVYRAVDWEPYEISMVPIGADAGAVTRAASATNPCEFTQERTMDPEQSTTTTNPAQPVAADGAQRAVLTEVERAEIAKAERTRAAEISSAGRTLGSKAADVDKAIADGMSADAFRKAEIDKRAKPLDDGGQHTSAGGGQGGIRVQQGEIGHDKWARAIQAAIIQRCGSEATGAIRAYEAKTGDKLIDLDAGEFRGMRILDVARACLDRAGVSHRGRTALEVLGDALTAERSASSDSFFANRSPSQTTSDFPLILENVLHKLLLAQYGITPDTWRTMCTIGSAVDFRPNPRYRLGSFSALDSLNEDGEFKNKALGDAEKQSITIATKGNILAISRQALLNDDMSAFSRLAMMFGRAAAFSIETDFYALLAQNAGLGPTMSDSNTLFHASHNNIGTGAALGSTAIDADRVIMKGQKDPSGNEILDIRPAVLLVPANLGGNARQINAGQYDFDALTKAGAARSTYAIPNSVGGLFRDIVDSARLSGTRRYLFADPAIYPVIEVVFLDGQQQPYMEMRQGWRIDGIEWKIRLDYAVGAIDFRGAVTNAGA